MSLQRDEVVLRAERPGDAAATAAVNRAAFDGDAEARLVDALRRDGPVIASLVALSGEEVVGHILFSQAWIDGTRSRTTVASLAPMAVAPARQRRGIGSALAAEGIKVCRRHGYGAIIVVGHPSYYPRFGFTARAVAHLESRYAGNAFMGLDLVPGFLERADGRVRYPDAFASL